MIKKIVSKIKGLFYKDNTLFNIVTTLFKNRSWLKNRRTCTEVTLEKDKGYFRNSSGTAIIVDKKVTTKYKGEITLFGKIKNPVLLNEVKSYKTKDHLLGTFEDNILNDLIEASRKSVINRGDKRIDHYFKGLIEEYRDNTGEWPLVALVSHRFFEEYRIMNKESLKSRPILINGVVIPLFNLAGNEIILYRPENLTIVYPYSPKQIDEALAVNKKGTNYRNGLLAITEDRSTTASFGIIHTYLHKFYGSAVQGEKVLKAGFNEKVEGKRNGQRKQKLLKD